METNEEEQEQAVVTSSSSPSAVVDHLDSKFISSENELQEIFLGYLEKPKEERVLTPELEQILIQIAKNGCSG